MAAVIAGSTPSSTFYGTVSVASRVRGQSGHQARAGAASSRRSHGRRPRSGRACAVDATGCMKWSVAPPDEAAGRCVSAAVRVLPWRSSAC